MKTLRKDLTESNMELLTPCQVKRIIVEMKQLEEIQLDPG